jgi:hypothetical protein
LQQVLRVEAKALEQAGVLIGVDLVGEFLFCLAGLILLATLTQQVQNRALSICTGWPPLVTLAAGFG